MQTHNPAIAAAAALQYEQQDDGPRRAAIEALEVLETPINGHACIHVIRRKHAIRLLEAAFKAIWEAKAHAT
jgi:hypothetical protein